MLAIMRFRYGDRAAESAVSSDTTARAAADLGTALDGLAACRGFLGGSVGRAMDDPELWVLETRWESVGAYRRALSSYAVKTAVVQLLSKALDEPSAFEVVVGEGATPLNESRPRGTVG